jgi:hypothetical protein
VRAAVLEEGEGREDGEGEDVAEDAEDNAVDVDVERQLRDDVVPGVDELRTHHRHVRFPLTAITADTDLPLRLRSSTPTLLWQQRSLVYSFRPGFLISLV